MMRGALIILLAMFLVFVGAQIVLFSERNRVAEQEFEAMAAELKEIRAEQESLRTDYTYYLNPVNLEKELRARFNYRAPDETLIIIVPQQP
jgi:cell division protein FtsB